MASTVPDPKEQFQEYQQALLNVLETVIESTNALPKDLGFFRSLDRQFAKDLDASGSRLLTIANNLLEHCSSDTGIKTEKFEDLDDVVDRYLGVVDVVDGLLEKADICLDEMKGKKNKASQVLKQTAPEVTQISTKHQGGRLEYKLLHASNVVRPQLKFKDPIDNSRNTPFIPKIHTKPHAKVPLERAADDSDDAIRVLPHPYQYEIENITYPDFMFEVKEPIMYLPFDTTSETWVENEEQLQDLLNALSTAKEIAIDLEHHNYRSFQGFTCLMQISTRERDFIIDTLELRDKLWVLNEYFADPNIVKVLHGAESDIIWLQRDFGLYIVNLFDTYFATKLLDFNAHGLAFLLMKYCSVAADKKYQLADWRIRPLPEEMIKYARSDTHYLLYIYDCLRNELLQQSGANNNLMRAVLQRSNKVALQRHEKEVYDAEEGLGPAGWKALLDKWKNPMNDQQFAVFKALHSWRDQTARNEDESVRYILPNHMLFALVERMPSDSTGVIGSCNPCPPSVRMNAQMIALLIQNAKLEASNKSLQAASKPQSQSIQGTASISTPASSRPVKTVERKLDPALFDLEKMSALRTEQAAKACKPESSLFGPSALQPIHLTGNEDKGTKQLVAKIRSSIRLALPFEGLKIKAATSGSSKAQNTATSSETASAATPAPTPASAPASEPTSEPVTAAEEDLEDTKEHVYVAPEQRDTKKKRKEDVLVLREMGQKRKQKRSKKAN